MRLSRFSSSAALLPLLLSMLLTLPGCSRQESAKNPARKPISGEELTCCYGGAAPALLTLASSLNLFAQEGIKVNIKAVPFGVDALEGLTKGSCDMAILAETPLVLSSFERSDLKILAALRSVDNLAQIVGRADKGIRSTTDLKGRRVGITKGTAPHYFLDLELVGQGLSEKQITPVFLKSDKLISSLSGGEVDAIAVTNTMAYKARQKLGDRAIILQNPGLCRNYSLLVTMQGYAKNQHERINSFLKALHEAEQFKKLSPAKSQELIIAALKISEIEYSAVLKSFDDRLTLDNGLIMTLEEHARWVIEKKMVNAPRIPNYLNTIEATHLQKISPDSVRLKR